MLGQVVAVRDFRYEVENRKILISCSLYLDNERLQTLWYDVSSESAVEPPETADAFFAPILLYVMKHSFSVRFEVPISDSIALQSTDVVFIFGVQLGLNANTKIEFCDVVTVSRRTSSGITGFSAGVDSWFTLKKTLFDQESSAKKVTHLLVNDVGANSTESKKEQVLSIAELVAREFDLHVVHVKSNINDVVPINFQKTHTARNASVVHLLTSITGNFYYSSTDRYTTTGIFPTHTMAYADPVLLPLLSSDAITLRSTGSTVTRAEKTKEIISIPRIGERLDVCINHAHRGTKINCGSCPKCMRTELTLEALGELDRFSSVFDLDAYRNSKNQYLNMIAASHNTLEREVFELAQKTGHARSRATHRVLELFQALREIKNNPRYTREVIRRLSSDP